MKEYILRIDEYADLNDLSIDDENIVWVNWHYPNGLGESTPEGTIRPYPSPWRTGTPTEEGWYLCFVAFRKDKEPSPMVYKWKKERGCMLTDDWVATEPILMWQKIKLPDEVKDLEQKITPFEASNE